MMTQSSIPHDNELFTAYLTRCDDKEADVYTFGYIDQDLVNGRPINYTSIDSARGYWNVSSTSIMINGVVCPLSGNTAIIDTGSTLLLFDDATVKNLYAAIPGSRYDADQAGYIFPASIPTDHLPVLSIAIGDHPLVIHKPDLSFSDVGNGMVYGGVQSRGNLPFNIYGGTALKSMYAIFNQVRIILFL
jgi:hypothetical protein